MYFQVYLKNYSVPKKALTHIFKKSINLIFLFQETLDFSEKNVDYSNEKCCDYLEVLQSKEEKSENKMNKK